VITFYATPKFPSSDCSYDVQIWPLSFAPCLTHLLLKSHCKECIVTKVLFELFISINTQCYVNFVIPACYMIQNCMLLAI